MPFGHERPRRVVHQHQAVAGRIGQGRQPGADRLRPRGPADDELAAIGRAGDLGGERLVLGGDHEHQPIGPRRAQRIERPARDGAAAKAAPWLARALAGARARAGRHDDGAPSHRRPLSAQGVRMSRLDAGRLLA